MEHLLITRHLLKKPLKVTLFAIFYILILFYKQRLWLHINYKITDFRKIIFNYF